MRGPDQGVGEGSKSSDVDRNPRAEKIRVLPDAGSIKYAASEGTGRSNIVAPVSGAEISYDSDPWQEFAFQRSFPAIQVYSASEAIGAGI
jgi:hypothetical protein